MKDKTTLYILLLLALVFIGAGMGITYEVLKIIALFKFLGHPV